MNVIEARRHTQIGEYRSRFGHFEVAQRRLARYYNSHFSALIEKIEVPTKAHLWGQPEIIIPRVVRYRHGDGLKLFQLGPIANRPSYYVVRVDSSIGENHGDEYPFCDIVDELYDEIEDQFGRADFECELCGWSESTFSTNCPCQNERWFPVADFNTGSEWGEVYWPA